MNDVLRLIEEILRVDFGTLSLEDDISKIKEWDSLAHLQIIAELEEKYGSSIPMDNIKIIRDFEKYVLGDYK